MRGLIGRRAARILYLCRRKAGIDTSTKKEAGRAMKPIRKSMIAVAAFISCAAAYALEVSSDEAREAVAGWASLGDALTGGTRFNASEITSVSTYDGADGIGRFYVVSFAGGGYAVTSGDTEISPILAYSESGEFVASDENPLWVLLTQDVAGRTKRLGNGEEGRGNGEEGTGNGEEGTESEEASLTDEQSPSASSWARLRAAAAPKKGLLKATPPGKKTSVSDLRVGPLCETLWNQKNEKGGLCYNYYTPENVYCGCVATAFAQIMKYFEWPKTKVSVGDHWYIGTAKLASGTVAWRMGLDSETGERYEGFDPVFTGFDYDVPEFGGPYDWANMPNVPSQETSLSDAQRQAIGRLTRDCGITVRMEYDPEGSGAAISLIKLRLLDQFDYANAELIHLEHLPSPVEVAKSAMLGSFDLGSPCAVAIKGHAIVGDGYGYADSRLYIHFNWGWGNSSNTAWYAPPEEGEEDGDYPAIHVVVYNIWTPETSVETNLTVVSGRVCGEDGEPVEGAQVTAMDKRTGETFSAESNGNGIYALLLPPETAYTIKAEKDGLAGATARRVERCVSNIITEKYEGGSTYRYNMGETVANLPGTDLTLTADPINELRWMDERASSYMTTGLWSKPVAYGADGKAQLYNNTFEPYKASTGNVVTVEFKAQFCEVTNPADPDENTQAAVRLGTNGCFQVWAKTGNGEEGTGNGWVDVEADGVTPVSGAEYTLRTTFDYTANTYFVEVKTGLAEWTRLVGVQSSSSRKDDSNSALQLQLETPTSSFPLAAATNCVTSVGFLGDTLFTSMSGDCRMEVDGEFATNEVVMLLNNAPFILNTAKAAWLNKLGTKTTVEGKLSGMRLDDVNKAYLLNLDFDCLDDVEGSYSFQVTDINVGTDSVAVSVTLTRSGKVEQKINGTLNFYGAATLAAFKSGATKLGGASLTNESFAGGETATATIPLEGETPPAFFNAKIEEK